MPELSRREFLKNAATSAAAAGFLSAGALDLHANPPGMPIGCQTWPVREMIAKDFPGTIQQLAAAGFQTIELCSPVGYAEHGFGGLAKYSGAELRKILSDAGVTCVSSHFGIKELRENQESRIAWAKDVGLTQMIVPSLDGPKISRPLLFHARPGLVRANQENRPRGTRHPRLEENLHRRENRRHKKLFRRNEPGHDESQRPLPSRPAGLISRSLGSSTQKETISSLFLYFLHTTHFRSHRLLPHTAVLCD